MQNKAYKQWYIDGLKAMLSANKVASGTTKKLKSYASSQEVLNALDEGTKATEQHAREVERLLKETGADNSEISNEVMIGIDQAAEHIASSDDQDVRDAGVIVSAQIALHYYMAAYGGMAATANHLGMTEQARTFKKFVDEVKRADEAYTRMAESNVNQKAKAA